MGAITSMHRIHFMGDSERFGSILSPQIDDSTVSQREVIILIGPLRTIFTSGQK